MGFKFDKKQLKPVGMAVAAGAAGFVGAAYAKPEVEKALGATAGKYADELIAAAGTVIAAASGGKDQTAKMVRNAGIGFAVKGVLGILDKYVFKNKNVPRPSSGMGAPLPSPALALGPAYDEPVEIIDWEKEKKEEPIKLSIV